MIFAIIEYRKARRLRHLHLALPVYLKKGYIMTKTLTLQNDAQAVVKVLGTDGLGAPIAVPAGTVVTSSDTTVFSASLNADGTVLVLPVEGATGSATLTATNGSLTDTADVVVTLPVIAAIDLDVADAVITAQAAPASTAPAAAPVVTPAAPVNSVLPQ